MSTVLSHTANPSLVRTGSAEKYSRAFLQSGPNGAQQGGARGRLLQPCCGAFLHHSLPHLVVRYGCEDDKWYRSIDRDQIWNKLRAAHSGHAQVEDEATRFCELRARQESRCGLESLHAKPTREKQGPKRAEDRGIVVHDESEPPFCKRARSACTTVGHRKKRNRLPGSFLSYFGRIETSSPIRAPNRTSSAKELAFIFDMTCARCCFTVTSVVPKSAAICLLSAPSMTLP